MRRAVATCAVLVLGSCGRIGFAERTAGGDAAFDAAADGTVTCGAWSAPVHLANLSSAASDFGPALSADTLTIYFHSNRGTSDDIYRSTRPDRDADFVAPTLIAALATSASDRDPTITSTHIMFSSDRVDGLNDDALYIASLGVNIGVPMIVPEIGANVFGPYLSADELELFYSDKMGQLIRAVRSTPTGAWTVLGLVDELNSPSADGYPTVSTDGTTIWFETLRGGAASEIYTATRASRDAAFSTPVLVDELNLTGTNSSDPEISADGTLMVFGSDRSGGIGADDLWAASRSCQ